MPVSELKEKVISKAFSAGLPQRQSNNLFHSKNINMNIFNTKSILGAAAMVLILGASAFTISNQSTAEKKRTTVYWKYNANSQSLVFDENQYSMVGSPSATGCDDDPHPLPCVLEVDESIDTRPELETYLAGFSTTQDIADSAISRKEINP
ncbi:hypothetical protein [Pedobacter ghigonis]|uniref:hypothetical protein n=1 Tax=Pedobacter ghigonis TaxID=2730403 RepID=UPI00158AC13F|nr:hypothetical protein [Pedobacter ghigonis]